MKTITPITNNDRYIELMRQIISMRLRIKKMSNNNGIKKRSIRMMNNKWRVFQLWKSKRTKQRALETALKNLKKKCSSTKP